MHLENIYNWFYDNEEELYQKNEFCKTVAQFIDDSALWNRRGAEVKVKYRFARRVCYFQEESKLNDLWKESFENWKNAYLKFIELLNAEDDTEDFLEAN